jgi:hypothetical protein
MKAIITNESKVLTYQESLDRMEFDLTGMIKSEILVTNSGFMDIENLQALVDKSIPKKVNGMINDWACARCDSDRGIIEEKPYCAVCGQKLDWSDSNE